MGLDADDYVLRGSVPEWLPLAVRRWLRDLTYREWHAALLGLAGAPLGVAWTAGLVGRVAAAAVAALLAGVAFFRLPGESGVAARLLSREPWYFVVPFVVLLALGYAVGVVA